MEITGQVVCSPLRAVKEQYSVKSEEEVGKQKSTKGGWKTMPFILGNESCANLALTSLHANLVVFLTTEYNKDRLTAAIIATIWGGSNLLSPLMGAYLADSYLGRAAIIKKEDFEENGSEPNPWKLCTVKKIQELKSVISVLPVWSSGIVASFMLMGSSHTYMVYQALHMNRNLGSLLVPASSYIIFSMLATSIWLPLYERVVLPFFRRLTKREEGISVMERIGTGLVISVQAMTVAALVEVKRRQSSNPISAFWLGPQYTLIGLAEAFYAIGMIEFFYERFPKSMSSTAAALFWCSMGIGLLLNSVVFKVVHKATGESGKQAWLPENLDQGHLEYYYCFCVGLGVLNFIYFLVCSRGVKYVETDGKNIITKGKEGRLEFSA
ncbi:protein NRT1/ PTR FAMILY 2.13-like [Cryptomeria japonica]|uniref:protein NRT1/ PTR FAMILY 2.13-like n=1 Tax=Cryptomeria japonica TaxID=3369 RepID=UPI0025AD5E4F|nr:protein NRT1/ PTR FAMILY 2.13-like [Cryptomeria japonica]